MGRCANLMTNMTAWNVGVIIGGSFKLEAPCKCLKTILKQIGLKNAFGWYYIWRNQIF